MGGIPGLDSLVDLRKKLHKYPELAGSEKMTSLTISGFLEGLSPDEIIMNIAGNGLAARFKGKSKGPRVVVRAELDALPIRELNDFHHKSSVPGIAHKCGHDGHMAIVAGVAEYFSKNLPEMGELVVLFQPAEETGEGAYKVMEDSQFKSVEPDYIIALHNLPGFETGEIVLSKGVFAAASAGMVIELNGKTSHAAEPENGISPSAAVSEILKELPLLTKSIDFKNFALITIIHARIGEIAFGTSPGEAVVMATIRAIDNSEMDILRKRAEFLARETARLNNLEISVKWTEIFPATSNEPVLAGMIGNVGRSLGMKVTFINDAFRWSEDFGWFTERYPGVLFGLGAGKYQAELHSPVYDFPDEIICKGVNIMTAVCKQLLNSR
ncbi:MAG: amidohydrolase [Bacteroidales bacterium]